MWSYGFHEKKQLKPNDLASRHETPFCSDEIPDLNQKAMSALEPSNELKNTKNLLLYSAIHLNR